MYTWFNYVCYPLWCYGQLNKELKSRAREVEDKENVPIGRLPKTVVAMQEVREIMKKLEEKNGSQYMSELYYSWAHMIQIKKNDTPPKLPYFKGMMMPTTSSATVASETVMTPAAVSSPTMPATVSSATTSATTLSPFKRMQYRSECMDQLAKWYALLQKGGISEQHYKDMQTLIMEDMNKF